MSTGIIGSPLKLFLARTSPTVEHGLTNRTEIHIFFLYLLAVLLTARVFAEFASRLQMPPVIGEILAGALHDRHGHDPAWRSWANLCGIGPRNRDIYE